MAEVTKKTVLKFDSDTNQLPYEGNPAQYCDWKDVITVEEDSTFDNDGVPVFVNSFSFDWLPVTQRYSPVLVRVRVRSDQLHIQSGWTVPKTLYTSVRYSVYKRRVKTGNPQPWTLVEVTRYSKAGPYQENWAGRVQYAVGIWHKDGVPNRTEGVLSATDFTNPYILFATSPTVPGIGDPDMNTKPRFIA